MELSLFRLQCRHTTLHSPLSCIHSPRTKHKTLYSRSSFRLPCRCSYSSSDQYATEPSTLSLQIEGRRALLTVLLTTAAGVYACDVAEAVSTSRRALRGSKIPESEFKTLPSGLKYYDLKVGSGAEALKGSRVAVHYVAKWKNITFMTSRQGMGVGGGTPYGFDVGQSENGTVLKGLDLGVQGMRVGGQRLLIVPPELAYGSRGVQEIPPNATIELYNLNDVCLLRNSFAVHTISLLPLNSQSLHSGECVPKESSVVGKLDVELLSIKQSPFGTAVKIVEG